MGSVGLKILKDARRRVAREGGWRQGDYGGHAGPNCAIGAIYAARDEIAFTQDTIALKELMARALRSITHRSIAVIDYNDRPRTTQDKIVKLFDRAIEIAEKEGF